MAIRSGSEACLAAQIGRRDFLAGTAAASLATLAPRIAAAQTSMPMRTVPATGEMLPVIGLGSSRPVEVIAERGTGPIESVLRALLAHGGKVVDTWPRYPDNDAAFGSVISKPEFRDSLFLTTKIDQVGEDAGIAQFEAALRNYRRETVDLAQVFSLTDVYTHWPNLQRWKEEGRTRYIGVTVADRGLYEDLETFVSRESPDFVQVNYSITEREAEDRMLPMLADRGIAVIINRPFMNGSYFDRLADTPVPEWAREIDVHTWAEFSLKYILANQDLTCVLTETTNPEHMAENALAANGSMPDGAARARMRRFIDSV